MRYAIGETVRVAVDAAGISAGELGEVVNVRLPATGGAVYQVETADGWRGSLVESELEPARDESVGE